MNQPTNPADDTANGFNVPDEDTNDISPGPAEDTEGHGIRSGRLQAGNGDDTEGHAAKFRG